MTLSIRKIGGAGFYLKYLRWCDLGFPSSLVVKKLPFSEKGVGSIPGRGAKMPCALQPKSQNIKQKQYCNQFSTTLKNSPHQNKTVLYDVD